MSQFNIDTTIYNIFNQKNDGVFVEAGAGKPDDQNNTAFFEKKGWSGLLVEPIVDYNETYKVTRPKSIVENYALVEKDYKQTTIEFGRAPSGLESGTTPWHLQKFGYPVHTVPCCTLDTLLRKHNLKHVDFLSLDAEGYEHHILKGIDFTYTHFNLILIEIHSYEWSDLIQASDFSYLQEHGYVRYKSPIPGREFQLFAHNTFQSSHLQALE